MTSLLPTEAAPPEPQVPRPGIGDDASARGIAGWALAAAVLVAVAHAPFTLATPVRGEEVYLTTGALLVWAGELVGAAKAQYQVFCTGCSVDAGLGGAALSLLGLRQGAWRVVALGWTALLAGAGAAWLRRRGGRAGASAWIVLLALPPAALGRLAAWSYGNHLEATALAVLALALMDRPRPAWGRGGIAAGLGLGVGLGGAFAVVGAALLAARRAGGRGLVRLLPGLVTAPLLWTVVVAVAQRRADGALAVPTAALRYGRDLARPATLAERATGLVDAALHLSWRAEDAVAPALAAAGAVAWLVALAALALRRPAGTGALALWAGAWAALYLASPFQVPSPPPGWRVSAFDLRYVGPGLVLGLLAVALAVGTQRGRARVLTGAALATMLIAGAVGRRTLAPSPAEVLAEARRPLDLDRMLLGLRAGPGWGEHLDCAPGASACDRLRAHVAGMRAVADRGPLDAAVAEACPGGGPSCVEAFAWGVGDHVEACVAADAAGCAAAVRGLGGGEAVVAHAVEVGIVRPGLDCGPGVLGRLGDDASGRLRAACAGAAHAAERHDAPTPPGPWTWPAELHALPRPLAEAFVHWAARRETTLGSPPPAPGAARLEPAWRDGVARGGG